jgi:D-glycero-alpha-D-manno-heptose 1-phosphate guanylyltransferase
VVSDRPKPLASIDGRSFLDRLLEHLSSRGLRRFILCTGHRAADIAAERAALGRYGEVVLSEESEPLGTAGAIANARSRILSPEFFVFNGDSFADVDLAAMHRFHLERSATMTLAVVPARRGEEGGVLRLDAAGRIVSFAEKAELADSAYLNAGVYLMTQDSLAGVATGHACSLEREIFPAQIGAGLHGFVHDGALVDIGTPERYARAGVALREAGMGSPPPGPSPD